jgi:hypothetical protein
MRAVGLLSLLLALPRPFLGQAWLSPKGEGTVSVLYQNDIERLHTFSDGRTKDWGHTYFDGLIVNTDFSVTDRLAVSVSLPYIAGKYVGSRPHLLVRGQANTAVALDNGEFHTGFQDFRLNARYALTRRELKVTPFFQAILPSHGYPSFGHAAIGFNEREYRVGVNIGRRLNPILPKAFVQGQYAFGFSPVIAANIAPKRSYGELQLGYLLTRRISFQGSAVLTWSHEGLDFDYNLFPSNLTVEEYLNHDRLARGKLLDSSGSIAYQVNRSTNLFLSIGHSFYGANGHLRYMVTTVGFTKAFSTKRSTENSSAPAALPEESRATACSCPKSK